MTSAELAEVQAQMREADEASIAVDVAERACVLALAEINPRHAAVTEWQQAAARYSAAVKAVQANPNAGVKR